MKRTILLIMALFQSIGGVQEVFSVEPKVQGFQGDTRPIQCVGKRSTRVYVIDHDVYYSPSGNIDQPNIKGVEDSIYQPLESIYKILTEMKASNSNQAFRKAVDEYVKIWNETKSDSPTGGPCATYNNANCAKAIGNVWRYLMVSAPIKCEASDIKNIDLGNAMIGLGSFQKNMYSLTSSGGVENEAFPSNPPVKGRPAMASQAEAYIEHERTSPRRESSQIKASASVQVGSGKPVNVNQPIETSIATNRAYRVRVNLGKTKGFDVKAQQEAARR